MGEGSGVERWGYKPVHADSVSCFFFLFVNLFNMDRSEILNIQFKLLIQNSMIKCRFLQ